MLQASRVNNTYLKDFIVKENHESVIILSSDEEEEYTPTITVPAITIPAKTAGSNKEDPIQLSDDDDITPVVTLNDPMICDSPYIGNSLLFDMCKEDFLDVNNNGNLESDICNLAMHLPPDQVIDDMDPPIQITTVITKNTSALETLRTVEMYLQSLSEPITIATHSRRSRRDSSNQNASLSEERPYVPSLAWIHSTWEDWTQLDVGDILHIPFRQDEIDLLETVVKKQLTKRKQRGELGFWQSVAMGLPGRSPLACRCFWTDYLNNSYKSHDHVVMIRRNKRHSGLTAPRHHLLSKRKRTGTSCFTSIRKSLWSSMTKEITISEGSGDAISLAIYDDQRKGVRVVVGSLCDENIQYNVPGNLRLWDLETENLICLEGHKTFNEITGQDIWRTVTDVKMSNDQQFIFSSSHDGRANIWRAKSGKLTSTLKYHSKPINQLAVNRATDEYVLATCSNDGTATVWYIGSKGNTGSGVICELDQDFYSDPRVECIEFGTNFTGNLLFLGINNNNPVNPGYVEAFDTATGKSRMRFDSMKGSVSTLAVSSSGRYIVSGNYNQIDRMSGDRCIHLHDSRHPRKVSKFYSGHTDVNIVSISPCERYVASGNAEKEAGQVVIYDVRQPKKKLHVLSHDQTLLDQSMIVPDSSIGIGGLHWMSDSRTMITGGGDSMVKVWSLEGSTKLLNTYHTSNCVTSLHVDEETMTIAAGVAGAQGIVHVWQP